MKKIYLLLGLVLLLMSSFALGLTDDVNMLARLSTSISGEYGYVFKLNTDFATTITGLKNSTSASTSCNLYNYTTKNLLGSGIFIGDVCSIDYDFVKDTQYIIATNHTGSRSVSYDSFDLAYPYISTNELINVSTGIYNDVGSWIDNIATYEFIQLYITYNKSFE